MAMIIKPDETNAAKKRVHFAIYNIDGLITDTEANGLGLAWACAVFAPAAGDLKVGYDNVASSNYGGTFAYRKNGEWYYEFSNAEVAASLGADTVYFEFYRTGYRTVCLRIPLRYDVESVKADAITASAIATDAIDGDSIKADAVTKIQADIATAAALTTLAGQVARSLGLAHENALLDGGAGVTTGPTYSAKKVMTSGRLRVFANAAALAAATAGAANDADSEVYRYTITGEDTGAGLCKSFKISRGL